MREEVAAGAALVAARDLGLSYSPRQSDNRHEYVDDVVAAVILERRSSGIGVWLLGEALRGRADLLVNSRRFTLQANAGVAPSGEEAALSPEP